MFLLNITCVIQGCKSCKSINNISNFAFDRKLEEIILKRETVL